MSKENRKREYDRLVELGRQKDICQSLKDQFGETDTVEPKKTFFKKKVK